MNHSLGLSSSSTTTGGSNSSNRRKLYYFVIICVVSFLMNYYNLNLYYFNHDDVDENYNTVESTTTKTTQIASSPLLKQRIITHRNASSSKRLVSSFNHTTTTLSEFEGRISRQEYHDRVDDVSTPLTEFPPPQSEWLNDIDTSRPAPCGAQKCVFHSKRNNYYYRKNRSSSILNHSNNEDGTSNNKGREELQLRPGYLVSQFVGTKKFKSLVQGYKKSKELSHKFHIQNLLLGLPHKFNISNKFANQLNNSTYASVKDNKIYKATVTDTWASKKLIARSQIFVQPILLVPNDHSLLFGCEPDRIQEAQLQLNTWIMNFNNNANAITTTTKPPSAFYNNIVENQLQSDFNATMHMLSSSNGRCMLRDFQIFITPQTGRMYHIDIDRCFEPTVVIPFSLDECMSILQNFTNSIIKIIGKNNTNY